MRRPATTAALLIALASGSAAQERSAAIELEVDVTFCADPERRGPPGLVWLRDRVFAQLETWPEGRAATAGYRLLARGPHLAFAASDKVFDDASYEGDSTFFEGHVTIAGTRFWVRCDRDGAESWRAQGPDDGTLPNGLEALLSLLPLRADGAAVTIDLAALTGQLGPTPHHDDPSSGMLRLGPGRCGALTLVAQRRDGLLCLDGRSDGGLLFPAMMVLAAAQRAPARALLATLQREQVTAFAVRGAARSEAARQLTLRDDATSRDALERLACAKDHAQAVAMCGLIHTGDPRALTAMVQAAAPERPLSEPLLEAGLYSMAARTGSDQSARVRGMLQRSGNGRLRSLPGRLDRWLAERRSVPVTSGAMLLFAAVLSLCALVTVAWTRRLCGPASC